MPTFVLMTKLSADALHDAHGRRARGREWMTRVKSRCPDVKWIAHYALLGPYDFMDIYEAKGVESAHRVSLISRSEGAVTAESWEAMPYEKFLELMEEIGS